MLSFQKFDSNNKYHFGVEVAASSTPSSLKCLHQIGYVTAFIKVYGPSNGGAIDQQGCETVLIASEAKLKLEIIVTPSISGKTGKDQFIEAYGAMKAAGIDVFSIWIKVGLFLKKKLEIQKKEFSGNCTHQLVKRCSKQYQTYRRFCQSSSGKNNIF